MPYVPGFANDIFISFSHADNSRAWVKEFQEQLYNRLIQIGAEVTIWRDSKLRGTDIFSDEIFTQLQQSALLISIVSPSGIRSRWCEDERQAFERFAALNGGFRFGNSLRAIKVVKTPLDGDKHRALFGVLGSEFYKHDPQTEHFGEFDQSDAEFHKILDYLAQDIKSVLDAFRRRLLELEPADKKKTVYVAAATPDLKRSRDAIVQQLEVWGYAVTPQDSQPARRYEIFQEVAKAELAASNFSIHLVSDQPLPIADGGQDSITEQYELAQRLLKDRIVWVEPGRQLYSQFDQAIKDGLQQGVEILQNSTIEVLKDVIGDKLKQRPRQPAASRKNEAKPELYLICDRPDHPSAESQSGQRSLTVKEYLDENGLVVMPPPYSEMEWNNLEEEHRAQLQLSNAVLLYWGEASENWFRKTRRIIVEEKNRRQRTSSAGTLTEAFYFSSPAVKKSQYRKLTEFVFEQYDGFEPNALQPLLDRLLANEEA
jgi:hypothetical protein